MYKSSPNDVYTEVNKMLMAYKTFGLCTWTYSQGEFKKSLKWSIASFITLWPCIISSLCLVVYDYIISGNTLNSFLRFTRIFSVTISLFLTWLMNYIRLDSFNRSLRKMQVVDYYLFSVGEQVPRSKPSKMILSMIGIITLPFSIFFPKDPSYRSFFFTYTFIMMLVVQLFLDRVCTILFLRYRAINNVLQKCTSLQGKSASAILEKMTFCHEKLCSSSKTINDFFSWQILFILTSMFIMSFDQVYAIVRHLGFVEHDVINKLLLVIHGSALVIAFNTIWRFGHTFSSITKEDKMFNRLLFEIMMDDKSNNILSNEKLMVHFTMNRELVFTACGMFKLDYTLVHSMIASATTYLILLIQFEKPIQSVAPTTSDTTTLPTLLATTHLDVN